MLVISSLWRIQTFKSTVDNARRFVDESTINLLPVLRAPYCSLQLAHFEVVRDIGVLLEDENCVDFFGHNNTI